MNKPEASDVVWNVPNIISTMRLVTSIGVFALIPLGYYYAALVVFLVSAGTDWIDGWWARRFNQVTKLGRVLDPFCDKVLICGTFILLAIEMNGRFPWYATIAGWMAVVVVARELLVTAIRSIIEGGGGDFSAKMAGKLKMWFQCIAVGAALLALAWLPVSTSLKSTEIVTPTWLLVVMTISNWTAILSTLWSGWGYLRAAAPSLGFGRPKSAE